MEKLDALEACMNEWLQTEEHRWFEPSTSVTFQHIHYQRHLEFTMGIGHNGCVLLDPSTSENTAELTWGCAFRSTWQDWGLRLARKTAFSAAAQYFCRQLGIIAAESPVPVVYADRDTQMWEPDADDGSSVINMQQQPGSPRSPTSPRHKEKLSWLGFQPPTNQPSALRARRAKSKKSVMRSQMGDA
jgi:hypothetical protein